MTKDYMIAEEDSPSDETTFVEDFWTRRWEKPDCVLQLQWVEKVLIQDGSDGSQIKPKHDKWLNGYKYN